MSEDRLDLRDTVMWGRRIAGLGAEVFEHRGRLDEHEHRVLRVEETRTEDMVLVAELREALKILRADLDAAVKALKDERELRDRQQREHVALHGKLNTRLKEKFNEAKPQDPQGELQE